jgi:hypothetical protein
VGPHAGPTRGGAVVDHQSKGGGHHREAVLLFPLVTGRAEVSVVVRDVGGAAERSLTWPLSTAP